jgi:hypothetical protein
MRVSDRLVGALSLFTSVGTLVCCALPSLLVVLGLGATVASVISTVPFLVTLSRHKGWVFVLAAVLIAASVGYRRWLAPRLIARRLACSLDDPRCRELGRLSGVLLWISVTLWFAGAAVAYGLPLVLD